MEAIVKKCEECEGKGEITETYIQIGHLIDETVTCEECKGTGKTLHILNN